MRLFPVNTNHMVRIFSVDLADTFKLRQLHFHWGENIYQGSEHQVDYAKFPLEMHIVHDSYTVKDRIAVLGFFFKISSVDNRRLDDLLKQIEKIEDTVNIITQTDFNFNLSSIMPENSKLSSFYRYQGSLSIPPCTENLTWSVFNETISISTNQMDIIYKNRIPRNFRHMMPLNNRIVYRSFSIPEVDVVSPSIQIRSGYFIILSVFFQVLILIF